MSYDFPNAPTLNQTAIAPNGATFIFDGQKWTTAEEAVMNPAGGLYLPLSGSSPMTGPLTLAANATQPMHAVPLQQINTAAAGGPFLPCAGGTVTGQTLFQYPTTGNQITMQPVNPYSTNVNGQQLESYMTVAASGGTDGVVFANTRIQSSIVGALNSYVYGLVSTTQYNGTGGTGAHLAMYAQGIRSAYSTPPSNNPAVWAATLESRDTTNQDSAVTGGAQRTVEIDMFCGNTDSGLNRELVSLVIDKSAPTDVAPTVHNGLGIYAPNGSYNSMLQLASPFNQAAVDLRNATATSGSAHAIWMGTSANSIAWNTSGSVLSYWDAAAFGSGGVHHTGNLEVDGAYQVNGAATLGGGIAGNTIVNGTSFLQIGSTGNALRLQATAAGSPPVLSAIGADTNLNMVVTCQGTGGVQFNCRTGFNSTGPIAKPTVTGAKGSNAALASLMTALAAYGLITDSTTA